MFNVRRSFFIPENQLGAIKSIFGVLNTNVIILRFMAQWEGKECCNCNCPTEEYIIVLEIFKLVRYVIDVEKRIKN